MGTHPIFESDFDCLTARGLLKMSSNVPLVGLWTSSFMKKPSFRVSLYYNVRKYVVGERDWFNQIQPNLFLGAIPLKSNSSKGHQGKLDEIPKKLPELGVTGVVSVNEEFERVVTLSSDEWNRIGVELLKVNCGDFNFAPKAEDLKAAADFIQNKVEDGGGVYVHCKAGRTRSATIVAAYLILHQNHTLDSAYELMKQGRPHVILHDVHKEALQNLFNNR